MSVRRSVAGALLLVASLTLSGCQVLDSLVGETPEDSTVDNTATDSGSEETATDDQTAQPEVEEQVEDTSQPSPVESAVPTCPNMYSSAQQVAFEEEQRQPEGDVSGEGYGYGTTNQDLIALIESVRSDLRVSCTWFLPPEFASTTTIAIVATASVADVEAVLSEASSESIALGGGMLWKLSDTVSNSGEMIANEAHFITSTECPESYAETACSVWIASTNAAGSSEALTRDAAQVFGALD